MPSVRRRPLLWLAAALAGALGSLVVLPRSEAQVPPVVSTTTTTTAPASTTTTAPASGADDPSGADLAAGSQQAPPGAHDAGGDGSVAPVGGIRVPPEAQRIIDSVHRTGSNSTDRLLPQLDQLVSLGLSPEEAYRIGLGRFPIAGSARYSHDWLYPRYGPGFRFHLGTDVFAAFGTPVRAPVDGIAKSAEGGLGGLTVKVVMPDGTYFYLAHLSGLVEGFAQGMAVQTGDIVGYVGDSGNARGGAPHLHLGIYPHGGPPIDPKPVLDGFLAEAEARLPQVLAAVRAAQPVPVSAPAALPRSTTGLLRPRLAIETMRPWLVGEADVAPELLYAAGANPHSGPRALLHLALEDLVANIRWE